MFVDANVMAVQPVILLKQIKHAQHCDPARNCPPRHWATLLRPRGDPPDPLPK